MTFGECWGMITWYVAKNRKSCEADFWWLMVMAIFRKKWWNFEELVHDNQKDLDWYPRCIFGILYIFAIHVGGLQRNYKEWVRYAQRKRLSVFQAPWSSDKFFNIDKWPTHVFNACNDHIPRSFFHHLQSFELVDVLKQLCALEIRISPSGSRDTASCVSRKHLQNTEFPQARQENLPGEPVLPPKNQNLKLILRTLVFNNQEELFKYPLHSCSTHINLQFCWTKLMVAAVFGPYITTLINE